MTIHKQLQKKGYTLIELVVVIGILVLLSLVFSSSLIAILKGSSKREVTTEVKQNGDYVLSVMSQVIRNAKTCTSLPSNESVTVTNGDGTETMFACVEVGGIVKVTSGPSHNSDGSLRDPKDNAPLTSRNVKVESCSFTCLAEDPPHPGGAKITLILSQNIPDITPRAEDLARQTFETTIYQRRYMR